MSPAAGFSAFSVAFFATVFPLVAFGWRGFALSVALVVPIGFSVFGKRVSAWGAASAGIFLALAAYGAWFVDSQSFLRSVESRAYGRTESTCLEAEGEVVRISPSGILFETDAFKGGWEIFARIPSGAWPKRGERAVFCLWPSGKEKTAYEAALEKVGVATGIRSSLPNSVRSGETGLARRLAILMNRLYPGETGALARGMVLGDGSGIDETWTERYRKSGLSHLVVASGGNIAILAGMLSFFVVRLRPAIAAAILLFCVWGYAALAGFGIPIVRAAVMASVGIALRPLGKTRPTNLLFATAVAFLSFDPGLATEPSFLLSFSATLGICRFSEPLERWLSAVPQKFVLRSTLSATLAATVATFPISVATFWGASIVSIMSNALVGASVLPIAAISVASMLLEALGLTTAATWTAFPGYGLLSFVNSVALESSKIPFGYWMAEGDWVGTAFLSAFSGVLSFWILAETYSMNSNSKEAMRF